MTFEKIPPADQAGEEKPSTISRREFLKMAGTAAAGLAMPGAIRAFEIDQASYLPSRTESLFTDPEAPEASAEIREKLNLMYAYGTFAEQTPVKEIDNLFKQKGSAINNQLQEALKDIAFDRPTFTALKLFLEGGGRFDAWPESGHYDYQNKVIELGVDKEGLELQKTASHELLHYVMDEFNSPLFEAHGGADHDVISPLEERFLIVQSIRLGNPPLTGHYLSQHFTHYLPASSRNKLKHGYEEADFSAAYEVLADNDFVQSAAKASHEQLLESKNYREKTRIASIDNLAQNQVVRFHEDKRQKPELIEGRDPVEVIDFGKGEIYTDIYLKDLKDLDINWFLDKYIVKENRPVVEKFLTEHQANPRLDADYVLTDNQCQDIVFLDAYNAALLQQAYHLARLLAEKKHLPPQKCFADADYQKIYGEFVKLLVSDLRQNPVQPIDKLAVEVMEKALKDNDL